MPRLQSRLLSVRGDPNLRGDFFEYLLGIHRHSGKQFLANTTYSSVTLSGLWEKSVRQGMTLKSKIPAKRLIGLISENNSFFIESYLSILHSGHVAVLLDWRLKGPELGSIVSEFDIDLILSQEKLVSSVRSHLASKIQLTSDVEKITEIKTNYKACDYSDELAVIIFTSGSTGKRKGVMLGHSNLIANTESIIEYLGLGMSDRMNVVLPFTYSYGLSLLNTHLRVGGSLFLHESPFIGTVVKELDEYQCTGLAGVPLTYQVLCDRSPFLESDFKHLRYLTQAGGKLGVEYISQVVRCFPQIPFYTMYGATEATSRLTYLDPRQIVRKLGSIGKPIPGVRAEILREDETPVRRGEIGELVVSGPNIMEGYLGDPEGTGRVLRDGRFFTGDLASQDAEGFLYIVGRKSRFIKSMGYKVGLDAVEQVLMGVEDVRAAGAFGISNAMFGEVVAAVIEPNPNADRNSLKEKIFHNCTKLLASYEVPQEITFVDKIPVTSSGKIDFIQLEKMFHRSACN